MKKKRKKVRNKWIVSLIGLVLLVIFGTIYGSITEQGRNLTGWKFYLLVTGAFFSIGLIFYGIYLAKKKK